jgi:hypothetical protein
MRRHHQRGMDGACHAAGHEQDLYQPTTTVDKAPPGSIERHDGGGSASGGLRNRRQLLAFDVSKTKLLPEFGFDRVVN